MRTIYQHPDLTFSQDALAQQIHRRHHQLYDLETDVIEGEVDADQVAFVMRCVDTTVEQLGRTLGVMMMQKPERFV